MKIFMNTNKLAQFEIIEHIHLNEKVWLVLSKYAARYIP